MMGSMQRMIIPDWGFVAIPYMGVGYPQTFAMRPRDVLAENLKKLMAGTPELSTFPQITKAGGGSNGTLDRIRRKTTATGIDNLEPLARVYGLEPWQLLLETLAVQDGRVVGIPRYEDGSLTPEALLLAKWFDKLTDERDRAVAETNAMAAILRVLQKRGLPPTDSLDLDTEPGTQSAPAPSLPPPAPTTPAKSQKKSAARSGHRE
jgi:hypothetical protein